MHPPSEGIYYDLRLVRVLPRKDARQSGWAGFMTTSITLVATSKKYGY